MRAGLTARGAGMGRDELPPVARLGGMVGSGLADVTADLTALDGRGRWAVVLPYDGRPVCARFASWRPAPAVAAVAGAWRGPRPAAWVSGMDEDAYVAAVDAVRDRIAVGDVYQANVCRVLTAPLPDPGAADVAGLHALLDGGNPAPYGGAVRLPAHGVEVACASPELFLRRRGRAVTSGPIKGTGRREEDLTAKDEAENVMIVDLVRNDLSRVCEPGSVAVPALLQRESHPGLVHLVSYVSGALASGAGWSDLLAATFPPGSVTGAPKSSALRVIDAVESEHRGVYCGAVGWVDADSRTGELAVAIRSFWLAGDLLRFGTGAGITWGSDPRREWAETQLKAERLVAVAAGSWPASAGAEVGG